MSKNDQTFKKPGKNGQKYVKTVKNVEKPGENRQKYQKNVKNVKKPEKTSRKNEISQNDDNLEKP